MEKTKEFNIETILKNLKEKVEEEFRRPFCSEAEFQFELALMIKETCEDVAKIYLEFPLKKESNDPSKHLDILVVLKEGERRLVPIELKYKTKEKRTRKTQYTTEIYQGVSVPIYLKNQGAKNLGCYYFVKDIERIEKFKANKDYKEKFKEGYAIMLTNDKSYLKPPQRKRDEKDPDYVEFALYPINEENKRRTIGNKELKWKNDENNKKYGTATLVGEYLIDWSEDKPYLHFDNEEDVFYILKINIK